MKSKINVEIYKPGDENSAVLKMVAAHNGTALSITGEHIKGYLLHRKIDYPSLYSGLITKETSLPDTLHISEDNGETWTLSLTWVEIHELRAQPTDRMQELGKIMYPHSTYSDMPGVMELANEINNNDPNDIKDIL